MATDYKHTQSVFLFGDADIRVASTVINTPAFVAVREAFGSRSLWRPILSFRGCALATILSTTAFGFSTSSRIKGCEADADDGQREKSNINRSVARPNAVEFAASEWRVDVWVRVCAEEKLESGPCSCVRGSGERIPFAPSNPSTDGRIKSSRSRNKDSCFLVSNMRGIRRQTSKQIGFAWQRANQ